MASVGGDDGATLSLNVMPMLELPDYVRLVTLD